MTEPKPPPDTSWASIEELRSTNPGSARKEREPSMWARAFAGVAGIAGLSFVLYLVGVEFDGVTVALFYIVGLFLMAGIANVAMVGRKPAAPSSTSDEI